MILKFLWQHKLSIILLLVIVYLAASKASSDAKASAALRAKEAAFDTKAKALGFVRGQLETDRALQAILTQKNATLAAQLAKTGARPVEVTHTVATIKATDVGAENLAKTAWDDEYGRFHLDFKTWQFTRNQKFDLFLTVVEGPDGSTRFEHVNFYEVIPATGQPIPSEEVSLETKFQVVKEKAVIGPFHQRLVATFSTIGFGIGSEFANWRDSVNLSGMLLYNQGNRGVIGGLHAGWRLKFRWLNTNVSIGPLIGYRLTPDPKLVFGAGATIELTR